MPPASPSTSCTADWIRQFKKETDGTRGYDALKTGFPPGALAPTTALIERSDGPLTPADVAVVQERLRASPRVAQVTDVQSRSTDGRAATLAFAFEDDPFGNPAVLRINDMRASLELHEPGPARPAR